MRHLFSAVPALAMLQFGEAHAQWGAPALSDENIQRAGENLPNDGTWIVACCACPHAAADFVVNNPGDLGYRNLAVIDEGILRWTAMDLPVTAGARIEAE